MNSFPFDILMQRDNRVFPAIPFLTTANDGADHLVRVQFDVKEGVADPICSADIDRPIHELKGFSRVELKPSETRTVQFNITRAALSYWSPETKAWTAAPGTFEVEVGASSRDIRLHAPLVLKK